MFHAPTLRYAILGLALMPAAGAFFRAAAQEPQGRVTGRVVNATTQQPIQGAVVQLEGTTLGTMSDATGSFDLPVVPPGIYSLSARAVGFAPYVMSDVVVGSDTVVVGLKRGYRMSRVPYSKEWCWIKL